MTSKFRYIIDELNSLATLKVGKSMSDEDFIVNIEAINLLINLHDNLGLDRKGIRRRMSNLYPEFSRRIYAKKNIQLAVPLIKALNDFIYGREEDRGPKRWGDTLTEMCCKVVDAYRKEPLISSTDYLFALDIVCCMNDDDNNPDIKEYKEIVASYLEDIDSVSLSEKIKRVGAYERAKHLFATDNWEKWAEIREQLKNENFHSMDDETFLLWCEVTDQYPAKELKKRSGKSKQMMLEYLRSQIISEFAKQDKLRNQRKLARGLKSLNDNIIGDIIPLKIDEDMSTSTLVALETIFDLRLSLAQIADDDNLSTYESLCHDRFEKIANALAKKYPKAETLNEKIEILEHLSIIGGMIHTTHSDFAIEEAAKLKSTFPAYSAEDGLTYAQQLRLAWIPSITSENESQIASELLRSLNEDNSLQEQSAEAMFSFLSNSSFIMATLALITDYVTDQEREAILNRYFTLFDTAITSGNTPEVANLLTLSAYWNSNPFFRKRIKGHLEHSLIPHSSFQIELSLPERCINAIAAEIYTQIDHLSGKYDNIDPISA